MSFLYCFAASFLSTTTTTRMRFLFPCVLLLSTFAAGLDFQRGSQTRGQATFSSRSYIGETGVKIAKRSLPSWLSPSASHRIKRRSVETGATCKVHQGFETKLGENTHRVSYRARVPVTPHTSASDVCPGKMKRRCRAGADRPNQLPATDGLVVVFFFPHAV